MAKKGNKTEDQFAQIEETLTRTEQYIEDNQKNLITAVGAIVAVIALFIGYQNLYIAPMEKEAQADMFMAELYFQNLGWVGFDPTNRCSPDERYIRVSSGLDANYAAPIKGIIYGTSTEKLKIKVETQQINSQQ